MKHIDEIICRHSLKSEGTMKKIRAKIAHTEEEIKLTKEAGNNNNEDLELQKKILEDSLTTLIKFVEEVFKQEIGDRINIAKPMLDKNEREKLLDELMK